MSIEGLKAKARDFEMSGAWAKALVLYERAIEEQDEEQPDIGLHNRAGDLQSRLGNSEGAVHHYETAVDLYMEAELPNNAIAVCKKVIRNLPDRHSIYLRMGKIRAEQGFLVDARHSFLTYAERMTAAGETKDALSALMEFCTLAPDDIEIRLVLAAHLESHERPEDAVQKLSEAHQKLLQFGRAEEAETVAAKIQELEPGFVPGQIPAAEAPAPEALAPDSAAAEVPADSFSAIDALGDDDGVAVVEVDAGLGDFEIDLGGGAEEEEPQEKVATVQAADSDDGGFSLDIGAEEEEGGSSPVAEAEPLPTFGYDPEEEGEGEAEALPTFDHDPEEEGHAQEEGEEEAEALPTFDHDPEEEGHAEEEGEEEAEPLPTFGYDPEEDGQADEEEDAEAEPLPTSSDDPEQVEPAAETEPTAEAEPAAAAGAEDLLEEARALLSQGDESAALEKVQAAQVAFDEAGDLQGAIAATDLAIELDPSDVDRHQRLVEYAFGTSDQDVLIRAYLGLADCLSKGGQGARAQVIYQQVLDMAPENTRAQEGVGRSQEGAAPRAAPQEVASSEDYVDLGSLLLDDDDDEEKTTRFVVQADEPSGDEAADFSKMLSQFKAKVAENIAADDHGAHYDLGTAYKEMGLLEEAIAEFQASLRASPGHLATHEMLGRCFLEKEQNEAAVTSLERAVSLPFEVEDELIGIYYYLARAQENLGEVEKAVEYFDKVFSLDINFMDVTDRLRSLR